MSNEELAVRVQNGDADAILLLWNAVERFVIQQAEKYAFFKNGKVEIDDLISSGYFAVLRAAKYFDPDRGTKFLTLLGYCLKNAFSVVAGTRTSKRDALMYCDSLNAPAFQWEEESEEQIERIKDDAAEQPYNDIEQADFIQYVRSVIVAALETLNPLQRDLLVDKYINNKSWEYCAEKHGFKYSVNAIDMAERALYRLEHGKYSRLLRECLDEFNDYNNYEKAAYSSGLGAFNRYGISSIEAVALLKDGGFENE